MDAAAAPREGIMVYADPSCGACGGEGALVVDRPDGTRSYRICACVRVGQRLHAADLIATNSFPSRLRAMTLSRYGPGESPLNQQALRIARNFVDDWQQAVQAGWTIGFYGPVGCGKTHLACAIAQALVKRYLVRPMIMDVPTLLRRERKTFSGEGSSTVDRAARADLLVLDDLGAEYLRSRSDARSAVDWVDEQLFVILNERVNHALPTVYTSNLSPSDLADTLAERVWSRLERTMVASCQMQPVAQAQRAGLRAAQQQLLRERDTPAGGDEESGDAAARP
jgi:DNA replication protein DnaC